MSSAEAQEAKESFSRKRLGECREAETCWLAASSGPARRCNDGLRPVIFRIERMDEQEDS